MSASGLAAAAGVVARESGSGRPAARWRLFVPTSELSRATYISAVAALVLYPWYADDSLLVGVGIALTTFVLVHGTKAMYRAPWLPGIMTVAAGAQWVLAPWAEYVAGRALYGSRMAVPAPDYFRFAVPCLAAFVVGLYLPMWSVGSRPVERRVVGDAPAPPRFALTCRAIIIGGAALRVMVVPFMPTSLRYAVQLASMLAIVGGLALLIIDAPRWPLWGALSIAPVAISSAADMQFLDVLLCVLCFAVVLIYRKRPSAGKIALYATPTVAFFLAISAFKALKRDELRKQEMTVSERATVTSGAVVALARQPSMLLSDVMLSSTVARLNEGWVTSRVLAWVPTAEPYAGGETILTGVRALVPRVLDPNKYVVGGAEIVPRFTGIELVGSTSMGLSIPGEMYANFGLLGSWIGTFVFAFGLGLLYRRFLRLSRASPLWWAWVPFVFFSCLSPEIGFAENVNHFAKSLLVMWAVVKFVPAWRAIPRRLRRRPATLSREAATEPAVLPQPGGAVS